MTRRGGKTSAHAHRAQPAPTGGAAGGGSGSGGGGRGRPDLLMHRHRLLRRTSFVLARKYRFNYPTSRFDPWPSESELREMNARDDGVKNRENGNSGNAGPENAGESGGRQLVSAFSGPKGYSRDELINFWRDLSVVDKRRLLRIRREVYLTALDEFLVQQNLCCECHDNVVAEWEDHERKRSGSRSLQDVFSVFPPFLDDEDDEDDEDDDVDEDDEDDEDEFSNEMNDESDEELLDADEAALDEEEAVLKYKLALERRRANEQASMFTDEYLAALEVGKRQEDELLRLIQKEERYIIIREDHSDFIMDLIRCGEQFSYLSPFRPGLDADDSDVDDEDDSECPGANTSHLAQEYLLEVLAIKFREQLEDAYQEALQHSLAVQAELLRDELSDLKASQKPSSSSKKKKSKEKKKRKKKDAGTASSPNNTPKQPSDKKKPTETSSVRPSALTARPVEVVKPTSSKVQSERSVSPSSIEVRDPEEDELDREVEQFRLLLEKINAESALRIKKKLVLPPGTFARLSSMAAVS